MELLIIIVLLAIAVETTYLAYTTFHKERKTALAPAFVDTSVLIDGRIVAVAASGFITRPLYIPRSVVGELQFLADNGDAEKRTRARHGLDVINQLQAIPRIKTVIFPDGVKADEGVDNRLLALAKKHHGALCTIDYNLNKVAVVEDIEVLNVNELAKSLRMAYLPGERMVIELTQKGNDQHQAVGHLDDGTMVVVEHAYKQLGSKVEIEFIRSLQTAAGKMMFAKLTQSNDTQKRSQDDNPKKRQPRIFKGTAPVATKEAVPAASAKPQRPQRATVRRTEQHKPQAQVNQSRQAGGRQNRRPRTHEDSLVELANRE